ncbi:MAG: NADH-quinone oxidoreductase subunit NuoE [Parachlamydiaceae bacterium]|nr:NADH-quinone oxidoreductase subunit NuoE [Parachlamydiaceae bacterium]
MLTEQTRQSILKLQLKYPVERSALIPALHLAQNEVGYLPLEVQEEVAQLFNLAPNEVHAVVTFYDMFYEKPMGKHIIHVCKNASCMLRGADGLLSKLCEKLQISPGETSADGEYSVIPCECMAACDRAPMMLVDETVVGPVLESDLNQVLANASKGANKCPK